MLKSYWRLTKPGIVRGNAITATGGFLFASNGLIDFSLLLSSIGGLALIIASACVFNNYIDIEIDRKMTRTKDRELVTGKVQIANALLFAMTLLAAGSYLLIQYTNILTAAIALFGFFAYVILYGYFKRISIYGTEIGSISGAVPPVVGYCAVTGNVDIAAVLLFAILVFWQMPHFYAIGIKRLTDYKTAKIPILPVEKGVKTTKVRALAYTIAFVVTAPLLTIFGYTGYTYIIVITTVGSYWLYMGLSGFSTKNDKKWADTMFGISLLVLLVFSVLISINAWLP